MFNPKGKAVLPELRKLVFAGKVDEAKSVLRSDLIGPDNQSYQSLGDLQLAIPFPESVGDYRRSLDISKVVAEVGFTHDGARYCRAPSHTHPSWVKRTPFH